MILLYCKHRTLLLFIYLFFCQNLAFKELYFTRVVLKLYSLCENPQWVCQNTDCWVLCQDFQTEQVSLGPDNLHFLSYQETLCSKSRDYNLRTTAVLYYTPNPYHLPQSFLINPPLSHYLTSQQEGSSIPKENRTFFPTYF